MRQLPLLLLCMIWLLLARAVEALDEAGGAETTFFYKPICSNASMSQIQTIVFADFVKYISTDDARAKNNENWSQLAEIFNNAGDTPLVETSRKLREAGFHADYEQKNLYPRWKDSRSVTVALRGMRGIATATKKNKYQDQKQKMIEALELMSELEGEVGMKLETKPATTSDGLEYTTYDVDATAKKNKGVEDLAQKISTAAEELRKENRYNSKDIPFVIHQGVMREANESITELRKKCP
ncbi:hypothetical protein BDV09DRAFT_197523 [Aspergillus tetrazonus]